MTDRPMDKFVIHMTFSENTPMKYRYTEKRIKIYMEVKSLEEAFCLVQDFATTIGQEFGDKDD
jgi:hypothetical protein